jgi:hypothetical protein
MLCGNTVKIITPDGDATIVILTKVEVVRLGIVFVCTIITIIMVLYAQLLL